MLFGTSTSPICYYYNTSGSYVSLCSSKNTKYYCSPTNGYSYSPAAVRLKFVDSGDTYGDFLELFIQNTQPKELARDSSGNPIIVTSNPITYDPLIKNQGIYIYDPQDGTNTNWICFQGDGELHVTVEEKKDDSKYWYDLKDGGTSEPDDITGTNQTITIPSSAFKEDHGRYVATVYFKNAFVKSLTQAGNGVRVIDTIESTINPSSSYPLVYSYEKPNGAIEIKTATSMNYDSTKEKFYIDLPFGCIPKHAAIKFSATESIQDVIEFSSGTNGKKGILSASLSGSNSNEYYTINSSSTSGILRANKKGNLELTVAPKFNTTSGTIKIGSGETQTLYKQETFKIDFSDMVYDSENDYHVNLTLGNLILIKATYYYRPDIRFPYGMERTQILDWRNESMSTALNLAGSNISMMGTYDNYDYADKYHKLNTNSCSPKVWNTQFASDISALVSVKENNDAKTKMFMELVMPEYAYSDTDTYFTGSIRLFSPVTRDSAQNFCQIQPHYEDDGKYNDMANMIAHSFTTPYNSVLSYNGYQEVEDTPTQAAAKATADICSKLKQEHGDNLRIYVIEYRKQLGYKTFSGGETRNFVTDHAYKTIEDCADYWYEINSEEDLKDRLGKIASDIKDFAGYTDARAAVK